MSARSRMNKKASQMRIIRSPLRMSQALRKKHLAGARIGFVPTMGALHEGHLSLIRAARQQTGCVVTSVFVNPLQFGPREDYRRYPRCLSEDRRLAASAGTDILFIPGVRHMYPEGFSTSVEVEGLSARWEGECRPGHFRGVATVVLKLLQIVQPTVLYLGQKDYQQAVILRRLVNDLGLPTDVCVMPIIREPDGLAMSSRNRYLTAAQRSDALSLSVALREVGRLIRGGERQSRPLIRRMRRLLAHSGRLQVEYATIVDANSLLPVKRLHGPIAVLLAVRLGRTRLIDNLLIRVP